MIANKDKNKEKSKQATLIPKPELSWFDVGYNKGNPKQMGLYRHQKKKKK